MLNSQSQIPVFFNTAYGLIPIYAGLRIHSEDAHKVEVAHFVDKHNYRGSVKMSVDERRKLKNAMLSHPDGKHCPTQFNQVYKITAI